MAKARSGLITSAIALALLAGCTPAQPTMAPPEPSPTCTPEAGGTPYPCTAYYYDQMTTKDKLYTEAETVYRKFLTEDDRINRAGGATDPTPILLETATGAFLEDAMTVYRLLRKAKATAEGGSYRIAWIQRVPGATMGASVVTMRACTDTSTIQMGAKGKTPEPGLINELTAYFVRTEGTLKIAASTYKEVAKC